MKNSCNPFPTVIQWKPKGGERMAENNLKHIQGEKIRRQYFTGPIVLLASLALFIPYAMLVFTVALDKFELSTWLSDTWISVWLCLVFSAPFVILSIFNRRFFGRLICVVSEKGICWEDRTVGWNEIDKIEYEINLPGSSRKENRFCYAVIYTKNETVVLLHAPLLLLSKAKKYSPSIRASVSKSSKWMIGFMIVVMLIVVPLIPLFA